ncbi:MAG TPA: hypothetical protein VFI29_23630 [Hanamia sp.]|nr:hypothetical protein [Hanamia sp.]
MVWLRRRKLQTIIFTRLVGYLWSFILNAICIGKLQVPIGANYKEVVLERVR